jgi:hypothetical protein
VSQEDTGAGAEVRGGMGGALKSAATRKRVGVKNSGPSKLEGNRGTDGTFSDVHVISIVWLLMIADF